ncbi:MAG: hypothetical protein AAFV53_26705 [Myxococcota bacterium]
MERLHQHGARQKTPERSQTVTSEAASSTAPQTATASANPLNNVMGWVIDMALFGFGFGLPSSIVFAADVFAADGIQAAIFGGMMLPFLCAVMGALSGMLVGAALRLLRRRVPAVLGLMLATIAANLPWLSLFLEDGASTATLLTWIPVWIIAVAITIPVSAIRRSQTNNAIGWNVRVGVVIGLVSLALRFIGMWAGVVG